MVGTIVAPAIGDGHLAKSGPDLTRDDFHNREARGCESKATGARADRGGQACTSGKGCKGKGVEGGAAASGVAIAHSTTNEQLLGGGVIIECTRGEEGVH